VNLCANDFTTFDTTTEELEGIIEFKCLPSGLHNVKEDLMYVFSIVLLSTV